ETWHYTASHTVTQAEINAGADLVNTAVVDTDQTAPEDDDATSTVTRSPSLSVAKDTDNTVVDHAGEVIDYTIAVANTGNVDLTSVLITDAFADATPVLASGDTDSDGVLDVGETWHYTASHTVTQAEINAGADLVNTAVVDTDQTAPEDDDA